MLLVYLASIAYYKVSYSSFGLFRVLKGIYIYDIIWAYGNVENGTVINPLPENTGAVILDLTLMPLPQPQPAEEQPSSEGTTTPTEEERNRG